MECNYLNLAGGMVGVDMHLYHYFPTVMGVNLYGTIGAHYIGWFWRYTMSVTFCLVPSIQQGFNMQPVTHIPIPFPPGPAQPEIFMWTNLLGTSQPMFALPDVSGEKLPLCAEPFGMFGINANCGFFPFTFTNIDVNPISIHRGADPADYQKWLVAMATQAVYNSAAAALPPESAAATKLAQGIAVWQGFWDLVNRLTPNENENVKGDAVGRHTLQPDVITTWLLQDAAGLPK